MAIGLTFAASGLLRRLRARMEVHADHTGRAHEGEPGTYARALEKLYEINLVPAVMRQRGVHPHLYDRLLAAGITPAYPRPAPPSRWRGMIVTAVVIIATFMGASLWLAFVNAIGLS